ncbi:MAG: Repeat-containing protein [Parcubacteria group bacterium GW2011_GWC1_38_22]|nr:MAG: Repeat-containing protein [Parcubacteria group bacterium GW2011_GWC1_38_22]
MVLIFPSLANAAVVFETDFEDVADWSVTRPVATGTGFPATWSQNVTPPNPGPPKKNDGSWLWNSSWYRAAPRQVISLDTPLATVGENQGVNNTRGMTYNIEVSHDYSTGWSGGSPFTMYLGDDGYHELYVSYRIKYDPAFDWLPDAPVSASQQKLVFIARVNELLTSSTSVDDHSSPTSPTQPAWLPHWMSYISSQPYYQSFRNRSYRSDGQIVAYDQTQDMYSLRPEFYPQGGPYAWPEDGSWHHYEYHIKMNSVSGALDGIQEVWLDGVKMFTKNNMDFVMAGGSTTKGWNYIELFDNAYIISHSYTENVVYPLYIDDVVVSTNYSGLDYIVGGADIDAPAAPSGLSVM